MKLNNLSTRYFYKGVKINGRTKEYIEKRLASVEKLLQNGKEDFEVKREIEIDMDKKGKFRVEVMIDTPYKSYRVTETTESIEGSIDLVRDELECQIRKDKEKLITLRRRGARSLKKKLVIDEDARF